MTSINGKIAPSQKSAGALLATAPGVSERHWRSNGECIISPLHPPYKKGGCKMPHQDPVARRAYIREWKRRNADKVSRWAKEDDARRHANRRAAHFGATGVLTLNDVRKLFAVGKCYYCGEYDEHMAIDHVIPLADQGPNHPSNIVLSCRSCNARKGLKAHPTRWSRNYDACIDCGTVESRHVANGRCNKCDQRQRASDRRCAA